MIFKDLSISTYKQSSIYKNQQSITDITRPLQKCGVNFFAYVEITEDHMMSLNNNTTLCTEFIKHDAINKDSIYHPEKIILPGYYMTSKIKTTGTIENLYNMYLKTTQSWEIYVIVIEEKNLRQLYYFGTNKSCCINIEEYHLFINYFNDVAKNLIVQSDKFILSKKYSAPYHPDNLYHVEKEKKNFFLKEIHADYYKLQAIKKKFTLSNREYQVLQFILQNKLNKEIANILNISTRTVEDIVNHINNKTNCKNKNELFVKYYCENNDLINRWKHFESPLANL